MITLDDLPHTVGSGNFREKDYPELRQLITALNSQIPEGYGGLGACTMYGDLAIRTAVKYSQLTSEEK